MDESRGDTKPIRRLGDFEIVRELGRGGMGMANVEPRMDFQQKIRDNTYTTENNVHYVTFLHSDMDNMSFIVSGWAEDPKRYGNRYRGQFAMGWGMSLTMLKDDRAHLFSPSEIGGPQAPG